MLKDLLVPIISACSIVLISIAGIIINFLIFRLNRKDKYILTLIDKKLDVLQKAYFYSTIFIQMVHVEEETKSEFIYEVKDFYNNNCLFIETKSRELFFETLKKLENYRYKLNEYYEIKKSGVDLDQEYKNLVGNFVDINTLPKKIEQIVDGDIYK